MAESRTSPASAVWFGSGPEPAFAMIHRPAASRRHGVVVCNTLGFEGLVAHRPLRHLGERLARSGFTVVRVDPRRTGDASGPGNTPAGVSEILDDLADAVDLLRGPEGCTRISLVGIRAGALFATALASATAGVENLALWAPVERGRGFTRELKALGRLSAAARPARQTKEPTGADLEVVGFEHTPALLEDLAALDLPSSLDHAPVAHALLIEREDQAGARDLADSLAAVGVAVDRLPATGWADFMVSDETTSVFPVDSVDAIAAWLTERDRQADGAVDAGGAERSIVVSDRLRGDGYEEWSVRIGGDVFAIVTEPTPGGPVTPTGQVVVMANTGSVNRTGPGRLYVQEARSWAHRGIVSVRVDLRGVGDSPAAPGHLENLPYSSDRIAELLAVIEWVHGHFAPAELTLFGICSAAYQSFQAARLVAPVDRAILVNQSIFYVGPGDALHDSTSRDVIALSNLGRWSFVRGHLWHGMARPRLAAQFLVRAARSGRAAWSVRRRPTWDAPATEPIVADLEAITDRGTEVHFVFSAEEPGLTYLRLFARDALDRLSAQPNFAVHEIDGGDHVFACPLARRDLHELVSDLLMGQRDPALSGLKDRN